jgi:2-polyprenyl-3-methyl-5-hydroxy-6-metoxy-1,4-benzoquinol methylase
MTSAAAKASAFWGQERDPDELRYHWLNHPVTRAHLNRRISGDPNVGSIAYWQRKFFPEQLGNVLSIGCGFGALERSLIQMNWAARVLGVDVSIGAIDGARAAAHAEGLSSRLSYEVIDINNYQMTAAAYDAVFGISAVHHIVNLEDTFQQCRYALKPHGLLFLDEYIGPSRFQYSDAVMEIMNRILSILPPRFRRPFSTPELPREQVWRPTIDWFDENDPSESVRSAEIVPTLKHHFDIIDFRPYGGQILHILLSGIAGNFLEDREDDVALLQLMALLEDLLEEHGVVESDFAAIVARPKPR